MKQTYERIRTWPVSELLALNKKELRDLEHEIKLETKRAEIHFSCSDIRYRRAALALKWIRGIRRLKSGKRGRNG